MAGRKTHGAPGARSALALELAGKGKTTREIAEQMGVAWGTAQNLVRAGQIKAGLFTPPARTESYEQMFHGPPTPDDAIDDATPGCARCGLRSTFDKVPHECLPTSIEHYMGRRGEMDCHRNRTS